jgi:hypothetical protein
MLSVVMLDVENEAIVLSVIMLGADRKPIMPSVIILSVMALKY